MGKYLNNSDIVMRTGKLAFYKCRGEMVDIRATTTDDWQTITVTNIANEKTAFPIVSISDIDGVELGSVTSNSSVSRVLVKCILN